MQRYSSRKAARAGQSLGRSFLNEKLQHATAYDRIAGYFSPSILEVADEAIEAIPRVRMIANSHISFGRMAVGGELAESARNLAAWQEWNSAEVETRAVPGTILERLYHLLETGRLEVRILPDDRFGLIHGKAGVITYHDGARTSFLGSANESLQAWKLNYELVWEDDSPEAVAWVQTEFDSLWGDPQAFALTRRIMEDILRNARRRVLSFQEWRADPEPAAAAIEAPVFRQELGLWNHQKYFVERAFREHQARGGARLILADQVGLGKTLQLGMAAQLMALAGDRPVLIVAPRTLLGQWQRELWTQLSIPSAYWDGQCWVDELDIEHEKTGPAGIRKCPRRIGLVSQGLIFRRGEAVEQLLRGEYECVVIDEAHRARRRSGASLAEMQPPGNHLLEFIREIARRSKSVLLGTATPVQVHAIEAWDLLSALAENHDGVLGARFSAWRNPESALAILESGAAGLSLEEFWNWVRNPLPPSDEPDPDGGRPFRSIRESLALADDVLTAELDDLARLDAPALSRLQALRGSFFPHHNPFIRSIIRRTRAYLEETIDPETRRPLLERVAVQLYGEDESEAVELGAYQTDAYEAAREYCRRVAKRLRGAGFRETLLLQRIGSSMAAGKSTALAFLRGDESIALSESEEFEEFSETAVKNARADGAKQDATAEENALLTKIIQSLETNPSADPKLLRIREILDQGARGSGPWLERGCIIFSQYYDSARWIAGQLSEAYPELEIGLYAGAGKSAILANASVEPIQRDEIPRRIKDGRIRLVVGTDAASEGLNLQSLGALINLDLPWNPTRLEQRKGRIQRIGQKYAEVLIYNLRYRNSVEDEVHARLSARLSDIHALFGQIPDTLEDVWVELAQGRIEDAQKRIDAIPVKHPFELKYNASAQLAAHRWETCAETLNQKERVGELRKGW